MLTKFLCKRFNLISKTKLIDDMCIMVGKIEVAKQKAKADYDNKEISEWAFYKQLWNIRGKLKLLEDLINSLQ